MRTIHRYSVPISDHLQLTLPKEAVPLHVAPMRNSALVETAVDVWFEVDSEQEAAVFDVHVVGTGNPMPSDVDFTDHIGSVVTPAGLVWHIYIGDAS